MDDELASQLARLLDRYSGPLELYALQWTTDAADVVQEAFIRLVQQEPSPTEPAAWLFRVVRNTALNQARSRRRGTQHEQHGARLRPRFVRENGSGTTIDSEEIYAALEALSAEEREVVTARLWGGLTLRQIAHLTDSSTTTVHRRFASAIVILRERLNQSWAID